MTEPFDSIVAQAATQHGAIARAQAYALGASPKALRTHVQRRRLRRVARDVYVVPGAPGTWRQQLWIAHLEGGPASVVARGSAAALHALPGHHEGPVDVLLPFEERTEPRSPGVRRSTLVPAAHRTVVDGLPVTTVARTLFDLAGTVPRHLRSPRGREVHALRMGRALDSALARQLTSLAAVQEVVDVLGGRGRPGTTVVRALLEERGPGHVPPESELEARFVELCAQHDLPTARRQVVLGGGTPIGRVDFLFPAHGVVVEVDGRAFHDSTLDREHDRWRDAELAALGLVVVRLGWRDVVHRTEATALLLQRVLAARGDRAA